MAKYTEEHFTAVKKIFRYLKNTKDLGITYSKGSKRPEIEAYVDASFAEEEGRKSASGGVILYNKSPVIWYSRVQRLVTLSTVESEYVSLVHGIQEILWMRRLLEGIQETLPPTTIFEDNEGAIALATTGNTSGRTKHIDLRYEFVKQHIDRNDIRLEHKRTQEMIADMLTKGLPRAAFEQHRSKLLS